MLVIFDRNKDGLTGILGSTTSAWSNYKLIASKPLTVSSNDLTYTIAIPIHIDEYVGRELSSFNADSRQTKEIITMCGKLLLISKGSEKAVLEIFTVSGLRTIEAGGSYCIELTRESTSSIELDWEAHQS